MWHSFWWRKTEFMDAYEIPLKWKKRKKNFQQNGKNSTPDELLMFPVFFQNIRSTFESLQTKHHITMQFAHSTAMGCNNFYFTKNDRWTRIFAIYRGSAINMHRMIPITNVEFMKVDSMNKKNKIIGFKILGKWN